MTTWTLCHTLDAMTSATFETRQTGRWSSCLNFCMRVWAGNEQEGLKKADTLTQNPEAWASSSACAQLRNLGSGSHNNNNNNNNDNWFSKPVTTKTKNLHLRKYCSTSTYIGSNKRFRIFLVVLAYTQQLLSITYHTISSLACDSVYFWKFMEYPPVLGSCWTLKLSVERPNGRKKTFPNSLSFPAKQTNKQTKNKQNKNKINKTAGTWAKMGTPPN